MCVGYKRTFEYPMTKVRLQSALPWLEENLKANSNKPTVINFHDFDSAFTEKVWFTKFVFHQI